MNVLGVMSGTSLDGVDAVLATFEPVGDALVWSVLARESVAYSPELARRLHRALTPEHSDVLLLTQLHTEVGEVYAEVVQGIRQSKRVDLVAISGQTVYHIPRIEPERGWHTVSTLQLGEAAIVTERCRVPVMADFRQFDLAAGGQGAPMVSFGDLKLYGSPGTARAVHNLGGISNLTYVPASGEPEEVVAFDTGPATCLINEAAMRHYGEALDRNGRHAAAGRVDLGVLERLLEHPYFALEPPKTTGREAFNLKEMGALADLSALTADDVLATLTALTAESIALDYRRFVLPHGLDEVLVAGGGALNPTLIAMIQERLPVPVKTFESLGWNAKDREALAFAVMAYYAYHGLPNTLPSATGAKRPVIAGKLCRPTPT
ncbi:MAG: anhydro-N-acetylmuramic acid kinase [Trueperaceae bacterium]|nr:MAG: anhydro-N-acetylmuramic acid kinase [Trueperaceae bacterium]